MRAPPGRAEPAPGPAPAVAQRPSAGVAQDLLTLQRSAGNRVVGAYLARAPVATAKPLAHGRRGNDVAALQSRLNQLSDVATALDVDGIFGPITARAVREFKAKHSGLAAGATVDAETDAAISEALTQEQDQTELARKLFNLGAASYERRKYGHAYDFFTRAGELANRPALLFSRAQALRKLGGRREDDRRRALRPPRAAVLTCTGTAQARRPQRRGGRALRGVSRDGQPDPPGRRRALARRAQDAGRRPVAGAQEPNIGPGERKSTWWTLVCRAAARASTLVT